MVTENVPLELSTALVHSFVQVPENTFFSIFPVSLPLQSPVLNVPVASQHFWESVTGSGYASVQTSPSRTSWLDAYRLRGSPSSRSRLPCPGRLVLSLLPAGLRLGLQPGPVQPVLPQVPQSVPWAGFPMVVVVVQPAMNIAIHASASVLLDLSGEWCRGSGGALCTGSGCLRSLWSLLCIRR